MTRRDFVLKSCGVSATSALSAAQKKPPNIVLIVADDQGFGDLGCRGNRFIRTPNMDRIARQGVEFTQFHASPVCSPTRASLMTGRYNYRTGVVDTFLGRSIMYSEERTIAEMLKGAGYRTGIFGKWHLGDNCPFRPADQGFEESLVMRGGKLRDPYDIPGGKGYFDPFLLLNGEPRPYRGYCTDVFAKEALGFIDRHRAQPFFLYFAPNAIHEPHEVPEAYIDPYRRMGLSESLSRIYGMCTNLDDNIGRLLKRLDDLQLARNTIVLYLSDNGPDLGSGPRYNAGMRDGKLSVYEGGLRVPCFLRWPGVVKPGTRIGQLTAHIDVPSTLLDACGLNWPAGITIDGTSLMPLLRGDTSKWPARTLVFQWHRGERPQPYRNCAALDGRWKMVNGKELYDLKNDPAEARNLASERPAVLTRLCRAYDEWLRDVSSTRGYDAPRIHLGTTHENPVVLTRQDWRGPRAGYGSNSVGYWEVFVTKAAPYAVFVMFEPGASEGEIRFRLNGIQVTQRVPRGVADCELQVVTIPEGPGRLEVEIQFDGKVAGAMFVEVLALQPSS